MQSALGFDVRERARVARATPDDARLVLDDDAQISDLSSTLRRLAAQASTLAGAADALAVAHPDDVGEQGLDELRSAIAAAGLDALVVPESIARTFATDVEGDAQVAIGAARYALGRDDRSGAIGGIAAGAAGGAAAGAAAGAAGRGTAAGEPSMADFGEGRDMSQFGEGSQMSDFGNRSMSDFGEGRDMSEFGEGRDMSEFGRQPQQPAAAPPPPPAAATVPPAAEPARSKAKLLVAAAVVVAVVAVGAVVALASGGGDDTAVDTGASDTTSVEEDADEDEPAAGDEETDKPAGPTAGGPIVFSAGDGSSAQIFVSEGDGADLRQVTQFGNEGNPGFQFTEVEWAPDGETIYFVGSRTDSEDGMPSLWAVDPDGTNVRELTGVGKPAFSFDVGPDGRLVVLRGQVPAERTIAVFDASGGSEQVVTRGQIDLDPSWTPDGDIVFARQSAEGSAIFRVKADGSGLQQLVSTFGFTSMPTVSPDGELMAWISGASAEERTPVLWVSKADGSEARVIEGFQRSFEAAGNPAWSKDSKFLLMTDSDGEVVLLDPSSGEKTPLFTSPPPAIFMRYDILTG